MRELLFCLVSVFSFSYLIAIAVYNKKSLCEEIPVCLYVRAQCGHPPLGCVYQDEIARCGCHDISAARTYCLTGLPYLVSAPGANVDGLCWQTCANDIDHWRQARRERRREQTE
ncbi:hypothetical protein DFH11DRAFT_1624611 [Phellopilus nigrolimitatus]|nr:hypothetical protein DFH11DRAFT_1624611 [Phellopilus nigrolimitatus]